MPTNLANVLTDRHSANSVFPRRNELGGWAVPASEWWFAGSEHMGSISLVIPDNMFPLHLCILPAAVQCVSWTGPTGRLREYLRTLPVTDNRARGHNPEGRRYFQTLSRLKVRYHQSSTKFTESQFSPSIIQFLLLDSHGGALPACTGQWDHEKVE